MFEILKNIPVPEKYQGTNSGKRASKYPFTSMEIGDCLAFPAESINDPNFKKLYAAAMSFARRVRQGYTFRFGQLGEGKYGCWKIESKELVHTAQSNNEPKRVYKQRTKTDTITKEMLIAALESQGTLHGASQMLNISSRTFSRLKLKYQLV